MARKNRMGILSGNTKHFNISTKKRLFDPLIHKTGAEQSSKSLETWIKENPLLIFSLVYNKGTIELAKDAHTLLMDVLRTNHPTHYQEIQSRKSKAPFRKTIISHSRSHQNS